MSAACPVPRVRRALALACPDGERLLVAVSGGSDSVALAAACAVVAPERTVVAHVDHGMRPDSGRDAVHARSIAGRLGLPVTVARLARAPGGETAAREARLARLAALARAQGAGAILTAHHRDDAHETICLHLLRGHRGDRALAGIPALRPLADDLVLLRPFLVGPRALDRAELVAFRRDRSLPAREDPTNRDLSIPRNAVRRLLSAGRPPLTADRLEAVRTAARRRLAARLARVAALLEEHLVTEGLGVRLDAACWNALDDDGDRVEALRLLGASLAVPRHLAVRGTVLARCRADGARRRGTLELPASPRPLRVSLSSSGWHLPDERLPDEPPPTRSLRALARLPQHP